MQLWLPDRLCCSLINANLDIICGFCNETTEKVGLGGGGTSPQQPSAGLSISPCDSSSHLSPNFPCKIINIKFSVNAHSYTNLIKKTNQIIKLYCQDLDFIS